MAMSSEEESDSESEASVVRKDNSESED